MASEPLSPGDGEDDDLAAWRTRALEAEQLAEELADELTATRAALAARETEVVDPTHLSLFDQVGTDEHQLSDSRAPDGSEPGVLPLALAAVAVVAGLAAALSWVNTGVGSPFTLLMLVVAGGLGWAAWSTRVIRVEVTVVDGIVTVARGDESHRFDLTNPSTKVDVAGRPGDTNWRVRFYRRALDPVDVDARMVEPARFLAQLRVYRPGL